MCLAPIPEPPACLVGLTRQERTLVWLLRRHYPAYVSPPDILDNLPGLDHAHDRQWAHVKTVVSNVRRKLGRGSVENLRGEGYRISPELHRKLNMDTADASCR